MTYTFSFLTEDVLKKLYSEYGLRTKEIGSLIGLTESAILLKLKAFKIPINPRNKIRSDINVEYTGQISKKSELTNDLLKELYEKGLTDREIGEMFDLTGEGVAYRRKKMGLETRDYRKEINHKRGLKDLNELTKEDFISEVMCCKGLKGVARKYSSTFKTVKNLSDNFFLDRNSLFVNNIKLSDVQIKVIIGGLLGDGGVYSGGLKGYYYKEGHCIEQYEYLKWKMKLLGDFVDGKLYHDKRLSNLGLSTHGVSFHTKKCIELAHYRDIFYKTFEGVTQKIIPENVVNSIDSFTFAIWFFDDGGLSQKGLPYICNGSPREYIDKAANILDTRFDLGCSVGEMESVYLIYFHKLDNFFALIKDYIHPCFYYKIPINYRFSVPLLDQKTASLPNVIKDYTPQKWLELSPVEQEIWVNNIIKYYSFIGFPYYHIKSANEVLDILNKLKSSDMISDIKNTGIFNKVYSIGSDLASSYFPHMWAAEIRGKRSVYNNYSDSDRFKKVITNVFKFRKHLTDASIRSELRHGSTVHNFKPLIAKTIYDIYCPEGGRVFDYSAGYGGRLLGAYCSNKVKSYIGTDPCEQTFLGLRKIQRRLTTFFPEKNIQIFNNCAEDNLWYKDIEQVDVCFSSPPYFDTEKYSDEPTQSYKKFPTINEWIKGFLESTIQNCYSILKEGGFFIINIADTRQYQLRRYAFDICTRIFVFERFFIINMPSYFSNDKYEPIFVFKKVSGNSPEYDIILEKMEQKMGQKEKEQINASIESQEIRKINKASLKEMTEEDKNKAIASLKKLITGGFIPSRKNVSKLPNSKFQYFTWHIERSFGSWNGFLKACNLSPVYEAHSIKEHVEDYLKICKAQNQYISFLDYEKITGKPMTRLKRIFYTGKPYHYLFDELKLIALEPDKWSDFLNNFED